MLAAFDTEWGLIFIAIAVLVLFGGSRLPKLFHSLGSAQAEYKKGLSEGHGAAPAAAPGSTVEAPGVAAGGPAPAAQPAPPASPAPGQPQPGA